MATTVLHLTTVPPLVSHKDHAIAGHSLDVSSARELVAQSRRMPWEGDTFTVHITAANGVRDDVWNTLLKTLEEPPPHAHFHLYAPSTDSIPRTIRSRSHVLREKIQEPAPDDASRLVRLYEQGDVLTLLREADRNSDYAEAFRAIQSLWIYGATTGNIDCAQLSEYHLEKLRQGASPRITMKALLLALANRHRAQP